MDLIEAELARLEQWLKLDSELTALEAPARRRGRPKGRRKGSEAPVALRRKRGQPKGSGKKPASNATKPRRTRGRPSKTKEAEG